MKIEEFVETLREGERHVRVARLQQEQTTPGTAANLRALIDHRRERDALAMLIADHPDLVARILVCAWETADMVVRMSGSVTDIRAHLLGGEDLA